jgi:hypothetical protein
MFGRDSFKEAYIVRRDYDPFQGTGKQGRVKMPMITFNPDVQKNLYARLIDGTDSHQWFIPSNAPPELIRQLTAEECIDGHWEKRHNDNHATDCETMGLTAAMVLGVFRQAGIELDSNEPATAAPTRKPMVYQTR